ncbi:hypothetical protein HDK64DRAFT_339328 [Phyllosticta capitalensis]
MGKKARNRKNGRPRPNDNCALPKLPQSLMATLTASLESSTSSVPAKDYFPLLRLPRELRDMIYEKMLVVGVVRIQAVAHPESPGFYNPIPNPRKPISRRATFFSPFSRAKYSYECAPSQLSGLPTISVLQTCWQVYRESASLFYSRNTFFFDQSDDSPFRNYLHCAVDIGRAFFEDRPRRTRKWFKSIKIQLGTDNSARPIPDTGQLFHCHDSRDQVADFYRTLRDRLKLDRLSILLQGWPPEVRLGRFKVDYHASMTRGTRFRSDPQAIWQSRIDLGLLLSLCDFPRVALEICAKPSFGWDSSSRDPGRLVVFVAFLRSRLLKGGEALGTSNIAVHSRHLVEVFYPADKPEDTMCRRHRTRTYVVRCDDDRSGQSFLVPAEHPPRLWNHCKFLEFPEGGPHRPRLDMCVVGYPFGGRRIFSNFNRQLCHADFDYAKSDNGDNDSLKDMEIDAEELECQAPESLLLKQDDLVKPKAPRPVPIEGEPANSRNSQRSGPGPENFALNRSRYLQLPAVSPLRAQRPGHDSLLPYNPLPMPGAARHRVPIPPPSSYRALMLREIQRRTMGLD